MNEGENRGRMLQGGFARVCSEGFCKCSDFTYISVKELC
jgi:hypothetical protein